MSDSVKVPVDLVVDLDMSKVDIGSVLENTEKRVSGLKGVITEILSSIDKSKATAPLLKSVKAAETGIHKMVAAQRKFNDAVTNAAKSTAGYKSKKAEIDLAKHQLALQKELLDELSKQPTVSKKFYSEQARKYEEDVRRVIAAEQELYNSRGQYASEADPGHIRKMAEAQRDYASAVSQAHQAGRNLVYSSKENSTTQEYQDELKNLQKIEQSIEKLNAKYKELHALGKLTPDGLAKMKYEAEQLQKQLETSKGKLVDMINSGNAFSIRGADVQAELNGINARLDDSRAKLDEVSGASANMGTNLRSVNAVIKPLTKTVNKLAKGFLKCVTGAILLKKQGKSTGNSLTKVFKTLQRNLMMYGLGFRTVYYAIKRLRTLFMKEIKLMAQQSSEMNSQVTGLTVSFNRLKGALGTAFQPLASVVIPILQTAMNYLTAFLESLGRFFATLTGQSYIYKAVAKNINSVAGAAKNANKQLGSYDKLDVISKDSGSGSDANDLGFDYEKVGIDGGSNFAKLIKEAWEKQDFTEVGQVIGNKLVEALNSVQWGPIREGAKNIANSIATLINGFFSTPDLGQSVGNSIANALGTAVDFAYKLLTTLDFNQVGQTASNIINTFVTEMSEVDETGLSGWAKLGQSYSNLIRGILGLITTAIENTDWKAVGGAIGTYISNLDIGQIVLDFTSLAWAILKGLGDAIAGWAGEDPVSAGLAIFLGASIGALNIASTILPMITKAKVLKEFMGMAKAIQNGGGATGGAGGAAESIGEAASSAESVNTATSGLTSKLTGLIKNLALGLVIILEVAAAATLFVAAIWVIGELLDEVRKAWEPVIEHGDTVVTAVGIGTALLVAIGVVTAALGAAGTSLIVYLALGLAMLALLGVNAALFLAEIILLGNLLYEVALAWEPVLLHGDAVVDGIGLGTTLLIAIGLVAALLGVAAVASYGALPLAIALGVAMLVELTAAFTAFCNSLIKVAKKLQDLAPELKQLNGMLPGLKTNMHDFTNFMIGFAGEVVKFAGASIISGIAATIDKIIGFFTADPIKNLYDEVTKQTKEFNQLIPALEKINPLIDKAIKLVGEYKAKMGSFENATGSGGGLFGTIISGAKGVINGLIGMFEGMANGVIKCVNALIKGLNKLSFNVPSWVPGIGGKKFGFNIKQISEIKIPRLATGAVIPPNKEFLAMLGDQKHGTNIEAPLDTIKQALAEVMAEFGGGSNKPIILQLDGKTVAKVVWDEEAKYYKQTGKYSPAY